MADINTSEMFFQPSASAGGCPPEVQPHSERSAHTSYPDQSAQSQRWFVMRVTYSRELKARTLLQDAGVTCYVPMRMELTEKGKQCVPAAHNLLFVRTSREFMDDYKRKVENVCPLRYMMDRITGLPLVVRDKEMEDFIRVTADMDEGVRYLDNPSVVAEKGTPVEVVSGPFKGVQGKLLRIRRNRKVVLQLAGVVAVAVDGIPMEWSKVIENL